MTEQSENIYTKPLIEDLQLRSSKKSKCQNKKFYYKLKLFSLARILSVQKLVAYIGFFCFVAYIYFYFLMSPIYSKNKLKILSQQIIKYPTSNISKKTIDNIMNSLSEFRNSVPNCDDFSQEKVDFLKYRISESWTFSAKDFREQLFNNSKDYCLTVSKRLAFIDKPLSEEEKSFPLAYGMLVFNNAMQIYFLLSAIYQPQNIYCIAVDSKSSNEFKDDIDTLSDCFPNIHVIEVSNVKWCQYSVFAGVYKCIEHLSAQNHSWKYYQYLSGVDLPLKTNLEMVRIFKQLNGTMNVDIYPIQENRLLNITRDEWPLTLHKSSLSAIVSREGIDFMVKNKKVQDLLKIAKKIICPDEAIWATTFGNPSELDIPGHFEGKKFLRRLKLEEKNSNKSCPLSNRFKLIKEQATPENPFVLHSFYISRYQIWSTLTRDYNYCNGKFTSLSCVYGLLDIKNLLTRPEIFAHKFYLSEQPAGYFCIYETIRKRAFDVESQSRFVGDVYSRLPQVRHARGEKLADLDFYFHDCVVN